jgi:hypothetical protein
MTNDQISDLRRLLAAISAQLNDAKTHARGISAYRSNADGFAFAVNKFQTAAGKLHSVADNLKSLAADLAPDSTAALTTKSGDNDNDLDI